MNELSSVVFLIFRGLFVSLEESFRVVIAASRQDELRSVFEVYKRLSYVFVGDGAGVGGG